MSDILDLKCFAMDGDFVYRDHLVSPGFHIDACMYKPQQQTFFGICEELYTEVESQKRRIVIGSFYGNTCKFIKLSDSDKILPLIYVVFNDGHAAYFPFKVTTQRVLSLKQRNVDGNMIYSIPYGEKLNHATVNIGEPESANKEQVALLFSELENFLSGTTIQNRLLYFDFDYVMAWLSSEYSHELFVEEHLLNIN